MKKTIFAFANLIFLAQFVFFQIALAQSGAEDLIRQLGDGEPRMIENKLLPKERYVKFQVRKLAEPKLIWANLELLRDMGIPIGSRITPEIEKAILDAFAWVSPDHLANPKIYTQETKTAYADFYGGSGIGYNFGSARAGIMGEVQIKGIGITPLLKELDDRHTARSSLHEAIKDAVWGEVTHFDFPFGGNRLVAIIDRGGGAMENGEPQILEVRVDPLRAGHYVPRSDTPDYKDIERAQLSDKLIHNALPMPEWVTPEIKAEMPKERIIALGLVEYARRAAHQFAYMHMMRIHHGAVSESNFEINGKMIDFGTATAQPGYTPLRFLEHSYPFGHAETEALVLLIRSFADKVETYIGPDMKFAVHQELKKIGPTAKVLAMTLGDYFDKAFHSQRERLALGLLGIPENMHDELLKKHQPAAKLLVDLTLKEHGRKPIEIKKVESFDAIRISPLAEFAALVNASQDFSEESLKTPARQVSSRFFGAGSLASATSALLQDAMQLARQSGIEDENFRKLLKYNTQWLHHPLEALYLPNLRKKTKIVNQQYLSGEKAAVSNAIESIVNDSRRSVPELLDFQTPVRVHRVNTSGRSEITAFDAQKGQYFRILKIRDNGTRRGDFAKRNLRFYNRSQSTAVIPEMQLSEGFLIAKIPLVSPDDEIQLRPPSTQRPVSNSPKSCRAIFVGSGS